MNLKNKGLEQLKSEIAAILPRAEQLQERKKEQEKTDKIAEQVDIRVREHYKKFHEDL